MKDLNGRLRVALIQGAPVMFDKKATTEKAADEILTAGEKGAQLIVFPESYIPCYPYGMTFGFTVGARTAPGRLDWELYYQNSVTVPGAETAALGAAAKKARAYVSIGITERDLTSCTLYCTNLIFSPHGDIISHHRKLKPTGAERVIWGDGNRGEFPVCDSPWGVMGSLICWENYMPLARAALYQKGVALYLAPNTNDNPEWQDTIRHIAIEGHCYVMNVNQYFTKAMYPGSLHCKDEIERLNDGVCLGGSCVVDPYGHYVTQPVWGKEAIIYADIDPNEVYRSRMEFDAAGHYSRPDVTELILREHP